MFKANSVNTTARRSLVALIAVALAGLVTATVLAQDPASLESADVARVGQRLACRCGGCRNTVGTCPMIRCESADPLRRRIYKMKTAGHSDDEIVNSIVREAGVVALAAPPHEGWGLFTWLMPGAMLLIGFWVYTRWIKRNHQEPVPVTAVDQALVDRYQSQIDREMDESPEASKPQAAHPEGGVGRR